jgi:hypothetical protein
MLPVAGRSAGGVVMLVHVSSKRLDAFEVGITRRRALVAAGIAAGALAGVRVESAVAWRSAALRPRRAATYGALVAALQEGPDRRFRCGGVTVATRRFVRWYARQDAGVRVHVDAVLDALAAGKRLSYGRLVRVTSAREHAVVAAAVALAGVGCDPPPDQDEHPITAALGLGT